MQIKAGFYSVKLAAKIEIISYNPEANGTNNRDFCSKDLCDHHPNPCKRK